MISLLKIRTPIRYHVVGIALFLLGIWTVPFLWCSRESSLWWDDDKALQDSLANGVIGQLERGIDLGDYKTGYSQFNGEWLYGTYLMAGIGFGQMALLHPESKEQMLAGMEKCIEGMLRDETRTFDRDMWGNDPIDTLDSGFDHAAFLGYFNVLLGLHRYLDPSSPYAELNDRVTASLKKRISHSKTMMLQSYPGEFYPVDNCAVIGSIGMHGKATGTDHSELIREWSDNFRRRYADPETGVMIQALDWHGNAADDPRGSGTSLGIYFVSFADVELSRDLYASIKTHLAKTFLQFGAVREYPATVKGGLGDIDSGPVILGFSFSATGFSMAGARIHNDGEFFRRLYASTHLAGVPYDSNGARTYITGGPLGNAILLAMLTALPADHPVYESPRDAPSWEAR